LFNLVTGLEQKGVDVAVLSAIPSTDAYLYKERMDEWSGKIIYYGSNSVKYIFRHIKALVKNYTLFFQLLSKYGCRKAIYYTSIFDVLTFNRPDIIHFSFSGIAVQYLPIIKELNKKAKTIVSCRGTAEKVKPVIEPESKEKLSTLFQSIHHVHCVSKDMLNTVLLYGLDEKKAFVNVPAVLTEKFDFTKRQKPHESDAFVIVTTGRLSFEKGYIFALLACNDLKEKGKLFEYHILGDGPDKPQIQYLIHELGLDNYVYLHGKVNSNEVRNFLTKAHIFLLPSIYEGISNAVLEAMAIGVPVITTNAGGMEEVVVNGINGTIVSRFDQKAIFNALITTMDHYDVALKMVEGAYETIQSNHQLKNQVEIFVKEYYSLVYSNSYN